jgi:hypothetical protein
MVESVETHLIGMELGAGLSFENMTVFELSRTQNGGPEVVHMAFFSVDEAEPVQNSEKMASSCVRRNFRV